MKLGFRHSKETIRKMSEGHKGYKHSEETKAKMSNSQKGSKNHMYGKRLSKETRRKMSESRMGNENLLGHKHSEKTKKKMSESRKDFKFSEKTKKKMSKSLIGNERALGKVWSEERKQKASEDRIKAIAEGRIDVLGFIYKNCKKFWSDKNSRYVNYRSSYELYVFELLEKMRMVTKYKVEPFRITYFNGYDSIRVYIPDVLITYKNKKQELIEIKPLCFVNKITNQRKFKAAKRFCKELGIDFNVWTEDIIFKHNLKTPVCA